MPTSSLPRRASRRSGRERLVFLFNVDNTLLDPRIRANHPNVDVSVERIGNLLEHDYGAFYSRGDGRPRRERK